MSSSLSLNSNRSIYREEKKISSAARTTMSFGVFCASSSVFLFSNDECFENGKNTAFGASGLIINW